MHHVVIYGHMGGPLVQLGCAHGDSPAEINRATAEVLLEVAARFEETALRIEAAERRRAEQEQTPAAAPDPVFEGIAARLREEGLGDGPAAG